VYVGVSNQISKLTHQRRSPFHHSLYWHAVLLLETVNRLLICLH